MVGVQRTYCSSAHHLLRHVNRLLASGTHVSSSPATDVVVDAVVGGADDVLFARGREFGSKERFSRGWDVARRW